MIYRFKVTFEDNEEVFREIDIKSTQNFEDFHNIIIQSIGFDNTHDASFFISDDYWRKGEEIRLKAVEGLRQMSKCKMALLIDDPHQKFLYIYDPKSSWPFLVELLKIVPDDVKVNYPKCMKTSGEMPKQYAANSIVAPVDEDDLDEEELHSDDEAYVNAHSEDETALLEGEEGEEAETEEEEVAGDEEASEFEAGEEHSDGEDF
jgi:hypothetical protein